MTSIFSGIVPTKEQEIKGIPYFANSIYGNLEIVPTLQFFYKRYAHPLTSFFDITNACVVDCGAGYGWFSFAYLLAGGKYAFLADVDSERLQTAIEIGKILGLQDKMEVIHAPIHGLPFASNEVDIMVSIETLEHVGKENIDAALHHIRHITSQGILLTTPNQFFPAIAHDTRLPFAHWLPQSWRVLYANAFGREKMNHNNHFLSPLDLRILLSKFHPATTCLTFPDFSAYQDHYPFYLPYDIPKKWQRNSGNLKSLYYRLAAAVLGTYSYWIMPSLARIFVKNSITKDVS